MWSSLVVLLWVCCSCAMQLFRWDVRNTTDVNAVANKFRLGFARHWDFAARRLCARRPVMDNAYIAPNFNLSSGLKSGSFEVTLSLENKSYLDATSVLVGKWASFALNDYYPPTKTCNNQVCLLFGENYTYSSGNLSNAGITSQRNTITFAASWNFSDITAKRANEIVFFVNRIQLDTKTALADVRVIKSPSPIHETSHEFTVFCRQNCSICIDSMTIWDTELAFPTNAPLGAVSSTTQASTIVTGGASGSDAPGSASGSLGQLATASQMSSSSSVQVSTSISAPSTSTPPATSSLASSIAPAITETESVAAGATAVVIGAAVGGSLGFLFVLIGAGWLIFAFKKKAQQHEPTSLGQAKSEYGAFPPRAPDYDDVEDVRTSMRVTSTRGQ